GHKVRTGDAGVGVQKFLPQHLTCEACEFFSCVQREIGLKLSLEERRDTLAAVVNRGADKVRRLLIGNLEDEFRKIRFSNFNACSLKVMVQVNLFRGHALAFRHQSDLTISADFGYIARSFLSGLSQKQIATVALYAGFECCQ